MDSDGVLEFVTNPRHPMVAEDVSVEPAIILVALTNTVQVSAAIVLDW